MYIFEYENNILLTIGILFFVISIMVIIVIGVNDNRLQQIKNKVQQENGVLIKYHQKIFVLGPFKWWEKGRYGHIWSFTFKKYGDLYEGWVLFRTWPYKTKWVIEKKIVEGD